MYNSSFFNQIIIAITSALTTPSDLEEASTYTINDLKTSSANN